MRVAVTGTPGTGKTTAVGKMEKRERIGSSFDIVHLNDVVKKAELTSGYDEERDSVIVDFEAVEEWLAGRDDIVFESHLAHHFEADRVVVCRCHPEELKTRLETRDESQESLEENAESEALDVILAEAVENHGMENVYEIETTDRSPEEVAEEIAAVIAGEREPSAGNVSYVDYL